MKNAADFFKKTPFAPAGGGRAHKGRMPVGVFLRKGSVALFILLLGTYAWSAEVDFSARVDRDTISMDDSLVLRLSLQAESNLEVEDVSFKAPEFEEVNEHRSSFIRSVYENGHILVRYTQEIVKFLRPKSTGTHTIKAITAKVNGHDLHTRDLTIHVEDGGGNAPSVQGRGGVGNTAGLRAGAKKGGKQFFARAEVDQQSAYKGEQIFAVYYLYTQMPISQMEVDKFPTFKGFIAEQLEMPFRTGRPPVERVVVDGVAYQKLTLLRYALYPLQEGKLKVDPMGLKFAYQASRQWVDDADQFIHQFFQMVAPQVGHIATEPVEIQVEKLPEDGKPASYTGGVGKFTVMAALNRSTVRANDSVNLTIKVEGKGNASVVGEPKPVWPQGVDVYETKSRSKTNPNGVGEKIFEVLLIPRNPGKVTLPSIEFAFFDPGKKAYVVEKTDPIELQVEPGDPNAAPPIQNQPVARASGGVPDKADPEAAMLQTDGLQRWITRLLPFLIGIIVFIVSVFVGIKGFRAISGLRSRRREQGEIRKRKATKSWMHLKSLATKACDQNMPWNEVVLAYELLCGAIYDAIDQLAAVGSRSASRSELRRILMEGHQVNQDVWEAIEKVLAFAETVRFASSAGVVSEQQAREQLATWVEQAQAAIESIE